MIIGQIKRDGVIITSSKIGLEGFTPVSGKETQPTLGISFYNAIVPGMMMLFDQTSGCPTGWRTVTGVDNKYLSLTSNENNSGAGSSSDSKSHYHYDNSGNWGHGGAAPGYYTIGGFSTSTVAPEITYPAIKFLLCEKE